MISLINIINLINIISLISVISLLTAGTIHQRATGPPVILLEAVVLLSGYYFAFI